MGISLKILLEKADKKMYQRKAATKTLRKMSKKIYIDRSVSIYYSGKK